MLGMGRAIGFSWRLNVPGFLGMSSHNGGTRILFWWRTFTTYLTLASLLVGNLAGWVHVGCHDPWGGGCCIAPASLPAVEASDSKQPSDSGHACGCHLDHQRIDQQEDTEDTAREENRLPCPAGKSQPLPEHDSDGCTICQGFLASRQAFLVVAAWIDWSPTLSWEGPLVWSDPILDAFSLGGLFVRGPPPFVVRLTV